MSQPTAGAPAGEAGAKVRLGWLDALRGLAALTVVFHHASARFTPAFHKAMMQWFDPGMAGVLVFFLVSGYIVPASLERTGSLRRFWISRVFRIYPLLLTAFGILLLLQVTGLPQFAGGLGNTYDPVTTAVAHLTMLQDLLAMPNALTVLWTLSYEMSFYLLVSALYSVRQHHRSSAAAVIMAVLALTLSSVLPVAGLSTRLGVTPIVLMTAAAMAGAIALACSRGAGAQRAGALLGGALAVVLLLLNGGQGAWEGVIVLGVMFTGTAIYRAEKGQIRWRTAGFAATTVVAASIALAIRWLEGDSPSDWHVRRARIMAVLAAGAIFAIGYALRHRKVAKWLTWPGVISFAVYLLHPILLAVVEAVIGGPGAERPWLLAAFLVLLLIPCYLAYRLVEAPMQRLGRKVSRRLAPAPAATPPAAVRPAPEPAHAATG
ncbi:acyltransferase [Actinomadura barringtoniae]|uniref:Acyltransferase n=1 Tax=Actinomadura barringtoniae TaxID=1427535 RepID=A0A939T885_9ACTN|nr:acyltransferase [Actinomadura barringtoniae]MBO2450067.1 acyltransferase [Actinomadura barringtoniae]